MSLLAIAPMRQLHQRSLMRWMTSPSDRLKVRAPRSSAQLPSNQHRTQPRTLADEIATRTAYFEALASFWSVKKDTKEVLRRVSRLQDPNNWYVLRPSSNNSLHWLSLGKLVNITCCKMCRVNVLNAFSVRNQKAPEILEHFETQFLSAPTKLDTLTSHYLSALAYALSFQDSKKAELYSAIAKRAGAIGAFPESDYVNLENALKKAGVALPSEVKRSAEAAPLK
jgi:hypothetical protein